MLPHSVTSASHKVFEYLQLHDNSNKKDDTSKFLFWEGFPSLLLDIQIDKYQMWASGKWVRLKKFICGCGSLNKVLVQYFFAMEELVLFSFTSPPIEVLGGSEEEGERDKITTVEPLWI